MASTCPTPCLHPAAQSSAFLGLPIDSLVLQAHSRTTQAVPKSPDDHGEWPRLGDIVLAMGFIAMEVSWGEDSMGTAIGLISPPPESLPQLLSSCPTTSDCQHAVTSSSVFKKKQKQKQNLFSLKSFLVHFCKKWKHTCNVDKTPHQWLACQVPLWIFAALKRQASMASRLLSPRTACCPKLEQCSVMTFSRYAKLRTCSLIRVPPLHCSLIPRFIQVYLRTVWATFQRKTLCSLSPGNHE